MDVEQLHVVLQQSFSPDVNLRGPAEEMIRNLKNIKGSTTLLLQVAAEKQVSLPDNSMSRGYPPGGCVQFFVEPLYGAHSRYLMYLSLLLNLSIRFNSKFARLQLFS